MTDKGANVREEERGEGGGKCLEKLNKERHRKKERKERRKPSSGAYDCVCVRVFVRKHQLLNGRGRGKGLLGREGNCDESSGQGCSKNRRR